MRRFLLVCAAGVVLLAASPEVARAQPSTRAVAAEELFRAGRELMVLRRFKEACEKLDASAKLDPAVGTFFSLGECYSGQGRTASAWFAYRTARAFASQRGDPRSSAAEERALALEPQLSSLVVNVGEGVQLAIDGEPFTREGLSAPLPIDPGSHTVRASAPGHLAWSTRVDVGTPAGSVTVDIPALERLPDAGELARAHDRVAARRAIGGVLAGAGVVAMGAGAIVGMQAIVKGRDANRACPSGGACSDAQAVNTNGVAKTYADVASVTIPVGAALVLAGAYLFFSARGARVPEMSARVSSSGAHCELGWSW